MAAAITGFASGSTAEQVEFTLEPTLEPVSAASSSTTTGEVLVPITELTSQPSSPTSSLQSPTSTTDLLSATPLESTNSPHPSTTTATLTSSVATANTAATVAPFSSPIPPTSESAGLSGAAKVGIGLGIPLGILLCAAIIYFSIRYHRRRTFGGIRPTELHADMAEKNTKVQNRDDGVVRELY